MDDQLLKVVNDGFNVVTGELQFQIRQNHLVEYNAAFVWPTQSPGDIAFSYLTLAFDSLATIYNSNVEIKCVSNSRFRAKKTTTGVDIKEVYAVQILLENTWNSEEQTVHGQFSKLATKYKSFPGWDKWREMRNTIVPTLEDIKLLADSLQQSFCSMLNFVR